MKEKISLLDCKTSITIVPKESIFTSIVKDFFTLSMISFGIYLSQGSTWWTFVTGSMFLFIMFVRVNKLIKDTATTFKDFDEAIAYLESKKALNPQQESRE